VCHNTPLASRPEIKTNLMTQEKIRENAKCRAKLSFVIKKKVHHLEVAVARNCSSQTIEPTDHSPTNRKTASACQKNLKMEKIDKFLAIVNPDVT
jgi:hypothetical protein